MHVLIVLFMYWIIYGPLTLSHLCNINLFLLLKLQLIYTELVMKYNKYTSKYGGSKKISYELSYGLLSYLVVAN